MLPLILVASAILAAQPASPIDRLSAMDLNVQAAAVDELAAGTPDEAALAALWNATDRFDVRVRIAQVYERRGVAGLIPLLDLAAAARGKQQPETRHLIARSVTACGPDVLRRIAKQCDGTKLELIRLLPRVAVNMGAEAEIAPIARALTSSTNQNVRNAAITELSVFLPAPERSALLLGALKGGGNEWSRSKLVELLPVWSAEERAAHPEEFRGFLESLEGLLTSEPSRTTLKALRIIRRHATPLPHGAAALESSFNRPSATPAEREAALRAMIATSASTEAALDMAGRLLDREPALTALALSEIDPAAIPEPLIERLLELGPKCLTPRHGNAVTLLIAPYWPDMRGVGERAVPALRRTLENAPLPQAALAAQLLAALGVHTPDVFAATTRRFEACTDESLRVDLVYSMLKISPDDPATQSAVRRIFERIPGGPEQPPTIQGLVFTLTLDHRSRPWVSAVLESIQSEQDSATGQMIRAYAARLPLDLSEDEQRLLAVDASAAASLEAQLAFALAKSDEAAPDDAAEKRRREAIGRLARARTLSPAAVEALTDVLLQTSRIDRETEAVASQSPRRDAAVVLQRKASELASEAYRALIFDPGRSALGSRPLPPTVLFERLKGDPAMLVHALGSLPPDSAAIPANAAPTLLAAAETVHASKSLNSRYGASACRALALLPPGTPGRDEALLRELRFGAGDQRPLWAFRSLVDSRPDATSKLDLIREGLDDPRYLIRDAAIQAAQKLGPKAAPVLDRLSALARPADSWERPSLFLSKALREIAPGDPDALRLASSLDQDSRETLEP